MIFTSYFANRNALNSGLRLITVSLSVPYGWKGERYSYLAPTWEMINLARCGNTDEYFKLYSDRILSRLEPLKVYKELNDSILLCWEKPGKFCHRRIIAQWLENATGNNVKEFGYDAN